MTTFTRKKLLRHKGRAGGDVEVFAMIPDEVLRSDAWKTAPYQVQSLLCVVAAQYRGYNNGSLTFTRETARDYGMTNPYMLIESFAELEARGLVLRTRPGTSEPPRSAMFTLGWRKIDPPDPEDPHDATPTLQAPNDWARWVAKQKGAHWTTPRRDRSKEKDRVHPQFKKPTDDRRSAVDSTLAVFPGDTKTGIPVDTRETANGYPRGHSRSAEIWYPRGHFSEISGVGGPENSARVPASRYASGDGQDADAPPCTGSAPMVGDLAERRDELLRTGRALIVEHGYGERAPAPFFGQMRRIAGGSEGHLLVAIAEYLDRKPVNGNGKPFDAKEWIYLRVRELVGRPVVMDGRPLRLP